MTAIAVGMFIGAVGGICIGILARDVWERASFDRGGNMKTLSLRECIEAWKAMSDPSTPDDERRAIARLVEEHNLALSARRAIDYARRRGLIADHEVSDGR